MHSINKKKELKNNIEVGNKTNNIDINDNVDYIVDNKNNNLLKETIDKSFVKVLEDFKNNFVIQEQEDDGIEEIVKTFYNSSLFNEKVKKIAKIVEGIGIKPPFIDKTLTGILYEESDKKIKKLREYGIIEDNEKINAKNFLNESYIKGVISAAKEKGVNITEDDIYMWLTLRPVFYHNDKFIESVKKVLNLTDEDIEKERLKEEGLLYKYNKEKEKERVYGIMEIMPSNMTYTFGIQRIENVDFDNLKKISTSIHMFNPQEAYDNIPSLEKNTIFNLFVRNDLISAIKKSYPEISNSDLEKIKEYADKFYKKHGIQIIPNEDNPYAIQGIYLKQKILNDIKDIIETKEVKKIIDEVMKIQNEIKEKTKKFVMTTTVNGWVVSIPEETLKEIEEKNYELIFKNNELYYYNEDGEKIKIKPGSELIEDKYKQDTEIMRTLAKTESEFIKNNNKFITGTLYKIDENGKIEFQKTARYLTEVLNKRNGEKININGIEYLRTNFDAKIFDSFYRKFSKRDAWYELITITKQKYGFSSSKEAKDKIKDEGIGHLVIESSKEDLERYKKEGLKALSFVKTNTFLNEDGTLKIEFETAKNNFFTDVLTKKEISYFEEESNRLLTKFKIIKRKIDTYESIINESADVLFNGVADFAVKKFLEGDSSFADKKDLLKRLENRRELYKNDPDFINTYGILKQLVKRETEIKKKIKTNKNIISFAKTNLEQSTDLKLTDNYEEKLNKIFDKSIESHFFGKVFQESNLFKQSIGSKEYDKNNFYSILSFSIDKINIESINENIEEKVLQPFNIDNFGFIHPSKYNLFKTNLLKLEEAESLFKSILDNSSNVDEVEKLIQDLKEGKLVDNSKIEDLIDENEWLLNYGFQLEKEEDKIREFLKEKNIQGVNSLKKDELYKMFDEIKKEKGREFIIEWNNFVNKQKQKIVGRSLELIYENLTREVIGKSFSIKEKYGLNKQISEIVRKYAFLKELEYEFSIRKEIFKLAFEKHIKGGVYPPITKKDIINNLELHLKMLEKELKEDYKNNKKVNILNGIRNLLIILETPGIDFDISDIKKALIPRENIEQSFGLFKEHIIENLEGIKFYEENLSKKIEESFRNIETAKYNEYIGMFEQLKKKVKQGAFSYNIEKLLRETFFKKLDETTISNYKNRLTERNNIISNLNTLYGDMVYKAVRKSYDALSTKKQIEELLDLSKKGLLPLMVKEDEKNSFIISIIEKEAEKIYFQYKKIFQKIKDKYINEKGELEFKKNSNLKEEEKEFIKQLYALYKIDFPHNKDPNKKEKLNVIMSLMFSLNGSPLIEKKDISFSEKRVKISKRLDERFPFLKNLDKNLITLNIESSDMSISEYQRLKENISLDKKDNFTKDKEDFTYLIEDLETKLLTISTEIDTLESRMKTIKNEMMTLHEKYERRFNENLKNNRVLNGSALENAFNLARFPLLMFEAFQIGIEASKQVIGEYFEYRRKILPLKEEINKRKEDLAVFMNEAQKTEEKIATEIQEFYMGFYSQNYNTIEEMTAIIEKMNKNGNKFAEYILSNPSIVERDNTGKIISINIENLDKEIKKIKNLLYGVYRTSKGGYRNIESLTRARNRIKALFAESQPNLFTLFLGSKDMIYYDELADFRIRKIFKAKFEVKDNAKQILIKGIEKENVETLRKYTNIDKMFLILDKFKKNTLLRSSNGSLMVFNIDEKALSEFRKNLAKKGITLEEAINSFINMSSLYTIDYEDFSDLNSIIRSLRNNSELSKRIEKTLINDKIIEKIAKENKEDLFKTKEKLKETILKVIINTNILNNEEKELLNKAGISKNEIEKFIQEKEISNIIQQSLHKVYFNTTKRFFKKENDKNEYASPNFRRVIEDSKKLSKTEFEKKYKIKTSDIEKIKQSIKNDIKNVIIDSINLYDYDLVKRSEKFGGGKISNTTKLLAENGSEIIKDTYSLLNSIEDRVKEIAGIDEMRYKAKIKDFIENPKNIKNIVNR